MSQSVVGNAVLWLKVCEKTAYELVRRWGERKSDISGNCWVMSVSGRARRVEWLASLAGDYSTKQLNVKNERDKSERQAYISNLDS